MFLSVDVGNTQTTLGLFDQEGTVVRQWRMATDRTDTSDQLHETLFGYFQMIGLSLDQVSYVAIASVVPILAQSWQRMVRSAFDIEPLMIDATRDCGIAINLPNPHEVGADRIANAISARTSYGSPVIVVDFGTATNIDVVDASGAFRGGAIMPGLLLSAQALFDRAAKLCCTARGRHLHKDHAGRNLRAVAAFFEPFVLEASRVQGLFRSFLRHAFKVRDLTC
jgi:type III pantothenate kinase